MQNIYLQQKIGFLRSLYSLTFFYGFLRSATSTLFAAVVILIMISALFSPALAQQGSLVEQDFLRINEDGFGDRHNSYAWSMAWFKNKLYVGTSRDTMCLNMWFLGIPPEDSQLPVECPPSVYEADLRAEIWCYTPETSTWERVYQSPLIEIPGPEGEPVPFARDAGYRTMCIFNEPNGEEALYIITYTPQGVEGTPPGILLRTTDGVNFENLGSPGSQYSQSFEISSYRGIEVYKGKMYITFGTTQGWGTVLSSENPASGVFQLASLPPLGGNTNNIAPFEMAVYNGYLWIGTYNPNQGYEVLKSDGTGNPYITFTPVVVKGAYRGPDNESTVSMYPFNDYLYVGSGILFGGYDIIVGVGPAPAELIRIGPDDTWDLICGSERDTPDGYKVPLSTMTAGFNNWYTGYIWRMQEHNGWLYVGTLDNSCILQSDIPPEDIPPNTPPWLVELLKRITYAEFKLWGGYDLWKTQDGIEWYLVTKNAMDKNAENYQFNYGARSFSSTPYGLFLGTADPFYGCEVWLGVAQQHSPEPPAHLSADFTGTTVKLSWTPPEGATKFRVFRRGYFSNSPAKEIGVTTKNFFVDTKITRDDGYCYEVRAEDVQGNLSYPSNMVYVETANLDSSLAVTLSEFLATTTKDDSVALQWRTESEVNNLGFSVYRSAAKDGNYKRIAWIQSAGNSSTPNNYQFIDEEVKAGMTYYYYIEDVDVSGQKNMSKIIEVTVGKPADIGKHADVPAKFALLQNYPNPFNPETWFPYHLASPEVVEIKIYDLRGQLVRTLHIGLKTAGEYVSRDKAAYWDGKDNLGQKVASGMYFYTMKAGKFQATRWMVIFK